MVGRRKVENTTAAGQDMASSRMLDPGAVARNAQESLGGTPECLNVNTKAFGVSLLVNLCNAQSPLGHY